MYWLSKLYKSDTPTQVVFIETVNLPTTFIISYKLCKEVLRNLCSNMPPTVMYKQKVT